MNKNKKPVILDEPELVVRDKEDIESESRLDEETDLNDNIDAEILADIIQETNL